MKRLPARAGFNLFLPKPPVNTFDKEAIILPSITKYNGVFIDITRLKNTPGIIA
jgi:hypothetical protein